MITETMEKTAQPLSTDKPPGRRAIPAILSFKTVIWILIIAGAISGTMLLPVKDWLIRALEWIEQLGFWGPLFVVVFYVIACVFLLPGSILTLGAGFIFKVALGFVTVSIASTLGACAAFGVGRTIARNWIARKVANSEKFGAVDEAVAQKGFKIVLLIRLSPIIPFNFLNYAFGLTKISFWRYALGSWIGMIPGTFMYVYFGAGLRSLADAATGEVETGLAGKMFFWIGLAVTIVVTVFVTRVARNALKEAVPNTNPAAPESETDPQV
ncbi:MAG: TVP38/TMEM64 family protein [Planctomycetota bacterium]